MLRPESLGFTTYKYSKATEILVICPFHNDKHPSMAVSLKNGVYHCFTCGASGPGAKLVARTGGILEEQSPLYARPVYEEERDEALAEMLKSGKVIRSSHPYLAKRGVTLAQTKAYGFIDYGTAIGLPIWQDDECIGIQMRNTSKKGVWRYRVIGEKPRLFRGHSSGGNLIVTEGIFGMLNAERHGLSAATILGASHDGFLWLTPSETALCVFDADEAGLRCAARCLINTPNVTAYVPGGEADELSKDAWKLVLTHSPESHKTWAVDLAEYSTNRYDFEYYIQTIAAKRLGMKATPIWW